MADISKRISKKSIRAKKKYAIKVVKKQAKEKIRDIKIQYAANPERQQERASEKMHRRSLHVQKRNAKLAYYAKQPRPFTVGEDIFNSIVHGIGAGLSIAAIVLLAIRAYFHAPQLIAPFVIFGATLFVTYTMSTLYHSLTPYGARKVFSVLDHCAIYLLIIGTFTPFLFADAGKNTGILTALLWGVCLALIVLYCIFNSRLRTFSFFTYFLIGWTATLAVTSGKISASPTSQALLLAGTIVYSAGCAFFLLRRVKWTHSVFHIFTLAASVLHFFSVFYLA